MEPELFILEDCEKWIALYWTFPVPWARDKNRPNGHTKLSKDADTAAQESKTIQYQQALVRREVKKAKRQLIDEVPYMEVDALRPGDEIIDALNRIAARCRDEGAGFVYVRFGGPYRARYHAELENWVKSQCARANIPWVAVDAEGQENATEWDEDEHGVDQPKQHYSGLIDPFAHFRKWKAADRSRKDEHQRERHISKIIGVVTELRGRGETFSKVATDLNSRNIYSTTGKHWTAEGLRKFVNNHIGNARKLKEPNA